MSQSHAGAGGHVLRAIASHTVTLTSSLGDIGSDPPL